MMGYGLQGRIRDLKKSSKALAMEIEILLHECDNLAMRLEIHVTDQVALLHQSHGSQPLQIGQNYGDMFGVTNSLKAIGCSLYLMRVVVAGSLAFAILDR